jgi:hypothetical protein
MNDDVKKESAIMNALNELSKCVDDNKMQLSKLHEMMSPALKNFPPEENGGKEQVEQVEQLKSALLERIISIKKHVSYNTSAIMNMMSRCEL